ncbi:MAG TPA: branched-chain amino acid transaminase [Chloroflexota bacterium]|nr:branched-chain amino acid transaminase [Chloroflexota bacterium]
MPPIEHAPAYMWMNGSLVRWDEATVHASTLGWSTMAAVFEGIKAYWNADDGQLYGLQFAEHYRRFATSMRMQRMQSPWSPEDLVQASHELLRANDIREDTYVRPLAYYGDSSWFGTQAESRTHVIIWTYPFQAILGSGKTLRACVSSWTRLSDNMLSPRIKCISNYQNSRLALVEANMNGYDSPILLNQQGKVTEGPASCLFIVRDGIAITPAITSGILESITRASVLRLCRESLGIPTEEREVDRTELYVADEIFFCGTGAEIGPVSNVDGYTVGAGTIGPITQRIESAFHAIVRGRDPRYGEWVAPVHAPVSSPAR